MRCQQIVTSACRKRVLTRRECDIVEHVFQGTGTGSVTSRDPLLGSSKSLLFPSSMRLFPQRSVPSTRIGSEATKHDSLIGNWSISTLLIEILTAINSQNRVANLKLTDARTWYRWIDEIVACFWLTPGFDNSESFATKGSEKVHRNTNKGVCHSWITIPCIFLNLRVK